ncbi:hypothetical protein [Bacillus sp. 2205SS5-2]|uniref:hypothetical protein n=1 Tax=Bacillus sp. 2205SS5-2 TaxID=3109031 RepID=UPI00300442C2
MSWYHIGAFYFPASWVAIVFAVSVTGVYLHFTQSKEVRDLYSNLLFTIFLTWKLSVLLFDFTTSIHHPFTIVYFHGGVKGFILGVLFSLFYLWNRPNQRVFLQAWVILIVVYEGAFLCFNQELTPALLLLNVVNLLFLAWFWKSGRNTVSEIPLLCLFTLFQGTLYSVRGELLSAPMLIYAIMLIFFTIQQRKGSR